MSKAHCQLVKMFDNADLPLTLLNRFEQRYCLELTKKKSWYLGGEEKNKRLNWFYEQVISIVDNAISKINIK